MSTEREFHEATLNIGSLVSIRHFGPLQDVNDTWSRLIQFAFHMGISGPEVISFGLCYDSPLHTPSDQIRYDACLGVSPAKYKALVEAMREGVNSNFDGIRLTTMTIPKTMMTIHRGPYDKIREAYTDALQAATIKGIPIDPNRVPTIEVYRNNPLLTRPEALLTEIHFLPSGQEIRIG